MKARALGAAAAVAAATLGSPAARADAPVPAKARALAERGRQLHDRGDYGRAIDAFKDAYVLAPSAGLVFNLAQAYRLHGDCEEAALLYRRYLAGDPEPERRALAEAHLATVRRCLDARAPAGAAPDADAPDAPAADRDADRAADPIDPIAPASAGRRPKQVGLAVTVGGGVALAGAVFFSLDARDAERAARTAGGVQRAVLEGRADRASGAATALALGGGLAALTGLTLYVIGLRAERAAAVTIAPAAAGTGLSAAWRF